MNFIKIFSTIVSVFSVIIFTSSCSMNSNSGMNPDNGFGLASFRIKANPGSMFTKIADSAIVTVSASDMQSIVKELTIADTIVTGTVTGIPAGEKRLFKVDVFDSVSTLQYTGSVTADVIADSTVNVFITIIRVSGNAVINGIILENDSIPTNGLVAYYPFKGNANDESGNGFNAIVNGANLCPDRFNNSYSAYNFDGVNDFILVDSIGFYKSHSFSAWAKVVENNSTDCRISDYGVRMGFLYGFGLGTDFCYFVEDGDIHPSTSFAMTFGKWHHFVGILNVDSVFFYADCKLISKYKVNPNNISQEACDFYLGCEGGNRYYYKGCIDDVRFYNRALNEIEVNALYRESR